MSRSRLRFFASLLFLFALTSAFGFAAIVPSPLSSAARPGSLSDNQVIESQTLGYKLQYRIYLPEGYDDLNDLPVLYVTDGQWYIDQGEVPRVLDRLIADEQISPVIAVFIDNRDPENLQNNRRNKQFFCSEQYVQFFTDELIPEIDTRYKTKADRTARAILGLSFGGLNSACFGLHAHAAFEGIAMQSPAMHPVRYIYSAYQDSARLPIKIFLSSGTHDDNEDRTRRLKRILEEKGYEMAYTEVPHGHNWANWKPLIDDVLVFYFGR